MRLTLRTLLAYLDDILDPADKESLGKKIETSDFAGDLILRTRDTTRRLRLSAPQVTGTGMGLDPNTVAEYLDNALPPDQVGDFERICLESDMHLAEVASCHHVLTMVLGSPADIDPASRTRMYSIPLEASTRRQLRVEPAHTARVAEVPLPPAASAVTPAAPTERRDKPTVYAKPEIPEYLRASGWSRSRVLVSAVGILLLAGIPMYLVKDLTGWFGGAAEEAAIVPNSPANGTAGLDAPGVAAEGNRLLPSENVVESATAHIGNVPSADLSAESNRGGVAASPPLGSPPLPSTPGIAPPATTEPVSVGDQYAVEEPMAVPSAEPGTGPAGTPVGGPVATDTVSDLPAPDMPSTTLPAEGAARVANLPATPALPESASIAGPNSSSQPVVTPLPAVTDPPAAEKLPDLGTYLGDKTVLLRWNDPKGAWFRVSPRSTVEAGARLLALPEFRPKLTFASGVHLEMSGGTRIAVDRAETNGASDLPAARAGVPAIDVAYGRVVLLNTANNENSVLLILGTDRVEVGLDRNAVLAVEVNRPYVPGNDPLTSAVPMEVKLYAPEGGVLWRDASGEKKIDQSSEWSIANGEMSAITANPTLPEWIDHEPPLHRSEQMFGAPVVEEALAIDRPADDQLLELWQGSEGKRKEVKSLAARSSIHVGLFVPFVEALRDSEQRPNWEKHIETLREAMARDRAAAESIRNTLVEQRGEVAAAELYEMLRGYDAEQIGKTPEQVRAGAVADLIDRLESDSLDYRVLAVQNLWEITGKRLMPNPAASLTERGLNVRRWRNRLEAGELVPSGE